MAKPPKSIKNFFASMVPKITQSKGINQQSSPQPDEYLTMSQYSPAELQQLLPKQPRRNQKTPDIASHLKEVSKSSQDIIKETRSLKALAPETKDAKSIFVSSIMSPNDMQQNTVAISVNLPELSEDINNKISNSLNTYFNDSYEFGVKLTRWLGECLYETGSKAIVILPKSNNKILMDAIQNDPNISNEALSYKIDRQINLSSLTDLSAYSVSTETLINQNITDSCGIVNDCLDELVSTEALTYVPKPTHKKIVTNVSNSINTFLKEHKNYMVLSDNPSIFKDRNDSTDRIKKAMQNKIDQHFLNNDEATSIMLLDDHISDNDFPSVMEFPTESVIPVCVPGSVEEHLGYFVIVDEWGNPIDQSTMDKASTLTNKAHKAMYGRSTLDALGNQQKNQIVETVFGITIENIMKQKLDSLGIASADIHKHNSMANCIFHNLVKKKKVGLIFVPESLMVYYRFDHRSDGTGKSMLEDVNFILSLRSTLMVAQVMATVKESRDTKVIEMELDPKDTNVEQTIDMVRRIYTEKQMLKFHSDPNTIAKDLTNSSLTIVPKGLPGLPSNMAPSTSTNSRSNNKADTDLLDKFTNFARSGYGVPASALNQLNDTEFSRSIVTQNLFFADTVRDKQRIVCKFNNKFVRTYIKYSNNLKKVLNGILADTSEDSEKEPLENNLSSNDLLQKVINNVTVSLPSPSVSTNKAQYEEIQDHISMISTILESLYSENLISVDDNELKDLFVSVRNTVKNDLLRSYLSTIGFQGAFDIPQIEDALNRGSSLNDLTQGLLNLKKSLNDKLAVFKSEDESSSRY